MEDQDIMSQGEVSSSSMNYSLDFEAEVLSGTKATRATVCPCQDTYYSWWILKEECVNCG